MAIKTIEYTVDLAGITPATEQFAGTQGDHRVTELRFALSQALYDDITHSTTDRLVYHFDVYDGEGGVWQGEAVDLTNNTVSIELEERHTRYGGKVVVYLVITALSADNETEVELYSFPAVLRLKSRLDGVYQDGENYESITTLAEKTKSNAMAAEKSNKELQAFAAQIEEKLKNGEFDGVGVEYVKIVDDELIITYTDGTVQNLGNVKGDAGPKGEKGDKGEDGKDAITDQTYAPTSENAQSGAAVAKAVGSCVPRKAMAAGAPFSSVLTVNNSDYNNGNENPNDFGMPNDSSYGYIGVVQIGLFGNEIDSVPNYRRTIPVRDDNGNLFTGTPQLDVDCVNKKYVDNFLPIQKSNGMTWEVYALNPVDAATKLEVEDPSYFEYEGSYGRIPYRQDNGNLLTNTPVKDLDCANKAYVDSLVGDIETALDSIIAIQEELIGGGSV